MDIISYFSDGSNTINPAPNSVFFVTQLVAVNQKPSNPNFANFSSTLSVNLSKLQTENVVEISCTGPGVSQAAIELVNVSIIEPSIPSTPNITMVTAAYQSGELNSVEVSWMKLVSL